MNKKTQPRQAQPQDRPQDSPQDRRLSRMIILSALVHVVLLVYMVTSVRQGQSETRVLQTYNVALVSPEALGLPTPAQPAVSDQEVKPEVVAPRPKPPPAKKKVAPQKPKVTQKEVKPIKAAKAAPKKKKTVKVAAKKKATPTKKVQQKVPVKTTKKPKKEAQPKLAPSQEQLSQQKDTQISPQERDQQILAALEKIRQRVKEEDDQARPAKSSGNSKPGASEQGDGSGAGAVRGLQFILYTEQVKRRMKQSWIVAEQKTGLTVIVRFGIQANGEVFAVELAQRSGDRVFDESAVRAVRKASPLPPPPAAYRYEFARQKVEVVFGETSGVPSRVQ